MKIRTLLLSCGMLAGLAGLAGAADMPVKAPLQPPDAVRVARCYLGVGTEAAVESTGTSGLFVANAVNGSMTAAGGSVDGSFSCLLGNALNWQRVLVDVGYQNITGADANGSVASRWHATVEYDIGFEVVTRLAALIPLSNLGIIIPTFDPQLPGNVSVAPGAPRQYVGLGMRAFGIKGAFGSAQGSSVAFAPQISTGFEWLTTDIGGKLNGGLIDVYVYAARPMRGFEIDGFGAFGGGVPISFHAGFNEGTLYGTGLRYQFPVAL